MGGDVCPIFFICTFCDQIYISFFAFCTDFSFFLLQKRDEEEGAPAVESAAGVKPVVTDPEGGGSLPPPKLTPQAQEEQIQVS